MVAWRFCREVEFESRERIRVIAVARWAGKDSSPLVVMPREKIGKWDRGTGKGEGGRGKGEGEGGTTVGTEGLLVTLRPWN